MNKNEKQVMEVPAIRHGTVIDHIPNETVHKIISILNLKDETTMIGVNLSSGRLGKKSIIKVTDKSLDSGEVNRISILAPDATLNIIKDYKVTKKSQLKMLDTVIGLIGCSNPNCITNLNPVKTRFRVLEKTPTKIKCVFCERTMGREEIDSNLL